MRTGEEEERSKEEKIGKQSIESNLWKESWCEE